MGSFHPERIQSLMTCFRFTRLFVAPVMLLGVLLLSACQPLTPTPVAEETEANTVAEAPATATTEPVSEASAAGVATDALAPTRLAISALSLEIPVTSMGWETVEVDGQRTTEWVVPETAAGWALNSAGAGEAGNVVIAGHQTRGDAVFAALALGEIEPGQEILLTDASGAESTYRVVEVSAPLPLLGATAEEQAQADAYIAPTAAARLTLVTGWPADTTTHRIFVVAELVATAQ